MLRVGTIRSKTPVELVGYEDEEAGTFIGDDRHRDFYHVRFTQLNLQIKLDNLRGGEAGLIPLKPVEANLIVPFFWAFL